MTRRLDHPWVSGCIALCGLALPACHQVRAPVSKLNVADRKTANQLLTGFYGVEQERSRWTARAFSMALKPPDGSAIRGARLWIHLFIPGEQIEAIGPMTLNASINEYPLAPQTFAKGGFHDFVSAVPATLLDTNIVPVQCSFDRAGPPSKTDSRELGAVVTDLGLLP